jgi:hypothetical protein
MQTNQNKLVPPVIPPEALAKFASKNPGIPMSMEDELPSFLTTPAIMTDAKISPQEVAAETMPSITGNEPLEELQRLLVLAQLRNADLEFRKTSREEAKVTDQIEMLKRAREQNIIDIRKQVAKRTAERNDCPHQKPNNRGSAIAGTRDHQGHYHFLCQYCQKEWTDGELPPMLRIDSDFIGGPIIGALVF